MGEKLVVSVSCGVLVPTVPNYVRLIGSSAAIDVGELTDDALREVGKRWTEALLERAAKRRKP